MAGTKRSALPFLVLGAAALFLAGSVYPLEKTDRGVYEYVIRKCEMNLDQASAALEEGIVKSPFRFLAKYDQAGPQKCSFRTRTLILYDPEYAKSLLQVNRMTGPFAVVDRINLFEDEDGLHAAIVNPECLDRTVLMNDTQYDALSSAHRAGLRRLIQSALSGEASDRQFGPIRGKGYIRRTMGLMAGGPFDKKIRNLFVGPGENLAEITGKIEEELQKKADKWELRPVYNLIMNEEGIAIVGVSSPSIESRSFSIVKEGGDRSRDGFECPGLAHAAAYPIEIVIVFHRSLYWVRIVDIMYRMKIYFEDAGNMAFAKNMGMPGSIEKAITTVVQTALRKPS